MHLLPCMGLCLVQITRLPHSNSKIILKGSIRPFKVLLDSLLSWEHALICSLLWHLGFRVRVSNSKKYSDAILFDVGRIDTQLRRIIRRIGPRPCRCFGRNFLTSYCESGGHIKIQGRAELEFLFSSS